MNNGGGTPTLRFETFKVELNDQLQSALGKLSGDSVTLGIRPEDIHVGENGKNSVGTQVELVEPLGNHALLYLRTEKSSFVAQSDLVNMPQHNAQMNGQLQYGQSTSVSPRNRRILDSSCTPLKKRV